MKILKQIEKIRETILEIISILNLNHENEQNFGNLSKILYEDSLINEIYFEKIKNLDDINLKQSEDRKNLLNHLNDIQLYLEMRFYHYL